MERVRKQLPELEKYTYFNYGSCGPLLLDSCRVMEELINEAKEPLQFHFEKSLGILEKSRKVIADLVQASPLEIAFCEGTSSGLSLIANAIKWKRGDIILYPEDEFPSNRYVWDNLKDWGVITRPIKPSKEKGFDKQLEELNLKDVRLIACSLVSYRDGRRHPIEKIAALCQKRGILLSVDAIQGVGAIEANVQKLGCDFLACGGQKWLFGPHGTGFVYIKEKHIEKLHVPSVGWASVGYPFSYHGPLETYAEGAKRFQAGYLHLPAIAGLAQSVSFLKEIGFKKIYQRIEEITGRVKQELSDFVITPEDRAGIITLQGDHLEKIQKELLRQNIITVQRGNYLRISMHACVRDEEIELLLKTIKEFCF